jgi:hypothetical protein
MKEIKLVNSFNKKSPTANCNWGLKLKFILLIYKWITSP